MHDASKDRGRGFLAWIVIALGVLWVGAVAPEAIADGKAFTRQVAVPAEMPDQEALIVHRDGVQTLVIETNVRTKADELAWVVPLPSVPEISETTTGVFPTLRALTAPRLRHTQTLAIPLAGLAVILLFGMFFAKSGFGRLAVYLLLVLLAGMCLMPALGKARSAGSLGTMQDPGVEVLSRAIVGSYSTEVIRSDDPDALTAWLREHGYKCPDESKTAIASYVDKKWVFAAMQLRRDAGKDELLTPHPLVFRFAVERPVYPMRLTLPQKEDFSLALYVFGDRKAYVQGMRTDFADAVAYEVAKPGDPWGYPGYRNFSPVEFRLSHDAIDRLVRPAPYVTKLIGTWKAGAGADDIQIVDDPRAHDVRARVWSTDDASALATQTGLGVLVVGLVGGLIARGCGWPMGKAQSIVGITAIAGLLASTTHYAILPKVKAASMRDGVGDLYYAGMETSMTAYDAIKNGERVDLEWIQKHVVALLEQRRNAKEGGARIREGDHPGGYVFVPQSADATTIMLYGISLSGHQYEVVTFYLGDRATDTQSDAVTPATVPDLPSGR